MKDLIVLSLISLIAQVIAIGRLLSHLSMEVQDKKHFDFLIDIHDIGYNLEQDCIFQKNVDCRQLFLQCGMYLQCMKINKIIDESIESIDESNHLNEDFYMQSTKTEYEHILVCVQKTQLHVREDPLLHCTTAEIQNIIDFLEFLFHILQWEKYKDLLEKLSESSKLIRDLYRNM